MLYAQYRVETYMYVCVYKDILNMERASCSPSGLVKR
jgi:hypothetical protein